MCPPWWVPPSPPPGKSSYHDWVEAGSADSDGWAHTLRLEGRDTAPCPLSPHLPTVSPAVFSCPAAHGRVGVDQALGSGVAGVARAWGSMSGLLGRGTRVGAVRPALRGAGRSLRGWWPPCWTARVSEKARGVLNIWVTKAGPRSMEPGPSWVWADGRTSSGCRSPQTGRRWESTRHASHTGGLRCSHSVLGHD